MIGIFVTRWHGGTKNEADCDELLSFCDEAGIKRLFVQYHEDIAVKNDWDYLGYLIANKGDKEINAWVTTTLGREQKNGWTKNRAEQLQLKTVSRIGEDGKKILKIDLTDERSRDYFLKRIENLNLTYPLASIYVDGQKIDGKIIYCHGYNLQTTARLVKESKNPILYCYGKFSSNNETKEALINAIR